MKSSSKDQHKNASKEQKAEVKLAEVEAQKKRLKNLIVLGKERGYLTYAEINDHLPDEMTDAEQIESVVTMLADMGIAVYDEAPDAETLLLTEAATNPGRRRRRGRGGRGGALPHRRLRVRPHHGPRAHVHARDGLGGAPHARGRDRDRQAHRGRPEAHDPGDLVVPDDDRGDPAPGRARREGRDAHRRAGRRPRGRRRRGHRRARR